MPRISLYVDKRTLAKIQEAAHEQRSSVSKWVAEQIRAKIEPTFPETFEALFGSIADDSFIEPADLGFDRDAARESL